MLHRNFPDDELGHKRTTQSGTVGKAWEDHVHQLQKLAFV